MPEVMMVAGGMWVFVALLALAMCRAAKVGDEMLGAASEAPASVRNSRDLKSEPRCRTEATSDEPAARQSDGLRVREHAATAVARS